MAFVSTRRTNATPVGKKGGFNKKMDNDQDMKPDAEGTAIPKEGKKGNVGTDKGPTKKTPKAPFAKGRGFGSLPMKRG